MLVGLLGLPPGSLIGHAHKTADTHPPPWLSAANPGLWDVFISKGTWLLAEANRDCGLTRGTDSTMCQPFVHTSAMPGTTLAPGSFTDTIPTTSFKPKEPMQDERELQACEEGRSAWGETCLLGEIRKDLIEEASSSGRSLMERKRDCGLKGQLTGHQGMKT